MSYFRVPEITIDGYVITKQRSLAYSPVTGGVTMLNLFSTGAATEFKSIEVTNSPTSGVTLVGRNSFDEVRYYEVDSSNALVQSNLVVLDPSDGKVKITPTTLGTKRLLGVALNPINSNLFPPYQTTPPSQQLLMVQSSGEAYINYTGSILVGALVGVSGTVAGSVVTYASGPVVGIALEAGGATFAGRVRVELKLYNL